MSIGRLLQFPHSFRLFLLCSTVAIGVLTSLPVSAPFGCFFVWLTVFTAVICDVFDLVLIAEEVESLVESRTRPKIFNWYLWEICQCSVMSIAFFVSFGPCISGVQMRGQFSTVFRSFYSVEYIIAAIFCLLNAIIYVGYTMYYHYVWSSRAILKNCTVFIRPQPQKYGCQTVNFPLGINQIYSMPPDELPITHSGTQSQSSLSFNFEQPLSVQP